jgi:pimeloyl-ACP methyl ester carboxylesterase
MDFTQLCMLFSMFKQSFYKDIAIYDNGKKGPAIFFMHGLGASAAYGEFLQYAYPDKRILLMDLPGHGASKKGSEEPDIYKIALGLKELFNHYGLEKPVLCGHSLGAQIALLFDIVHPYVTEQLILISPAGLESFNPFQKQAILSSLQFGTYLQQLFVPKLKTDPHFAEAVFPSHGVIAAYIGSMLERPVNDLLNRITCKSTVIFGENDLMIPNRLFNMDSSLSFAKKVLNAHSTFTILTLKNSGHWPMVENREGLVRLLIKEVPFVKMG